MENLPDDVLGSLLRRPDVTDLDVDHFSVNLNVNEGLGAILHNVCGISVSLASCFSICIIQCRWCYNDGMINKSKFNNRTYATW